jgi:hypothetical protein
MVDANKVKKRGETRRSEMNIKLIMWARHVIIWTSHISNGVSLHAKGAGL